MPYMYGTGRWIGRASDAETWGRDAMAHAGADGDRDADTTGTRTPAPPLLRLYPYAEYMRPSTGPACYFADVVDGLREADAAEMADVRAEVESWKRAALLKNRTRTAIRERVRNGESSATVAEDYGVPVAFVDGITSWQLNDTEASV